MKTYRITAKTEHGVFRMDSVIPYKYVVAYCGWATLPLATARRVDLHEGIAYGWVKTAGEAVAVAQRAQNEGLLNVVVAEVEVRELP